MRLSLADRLKVKELSEKYDIPFDHVKLMVESPYVMMKEKIQELDFKPDLTQEEFNQIKTNFNIPCLGKLYASHYLYTKVNSHGGRNKTSKE